MRGVTTMLGTALLTAGLYTTLPAGAVTSVITTPGEAESALSGLSEQQDAALAQWLANVLTDADFGQFFNHFIASEAAPFGIGLGDRIELQILGVSYGIENPVAALNLLPGMLGYEWQTTSGNVTRQHAATLNVPSLLDVDDVPGADVIATLAINGTSGVTLSVDKLGSAGGIGLNLAEMPLKIEAIIDDPRGGASRFAFGYDASAADAPTSFSESVTITGAGSSTQITVNVSQSGAPASLRLLAEEFTGPGDNRAPAQTIGVQLTPVPASINASVTVGDDIAASLAGPAADIDVLDVQEIALIEAAKRMEAGLVHQHQGAGHDVH